MNNEINKKWVRNLTGVLDGYATRVKQAADEGTEGDFTLSEIQDIVWLASRLLLVVSSSDENYDLFLDIVAPDVMI